MFFTNVMNPELDVPTAIGRLESLAAPERDFLYANINAFRGSSLRAVMITAGEYYRNKPNIKDRVRTYIDRNGLPKEAVNLANSKIAHPFFRKLVRQKVNYLLSKPFVFQTENTVYAEAMKKYLTKEMHSFIKNLGADIIVKGIAWVQAYYDETGKLQFKRIPSEELIPFWSDSEHTILEGIIRFYQSVTYTPRGEAITQTKVEYHTKLGSWYFIEGSKGLMPDPKKGEVSHGHFNVNVPQTLEDGTPVLNPDGSPVLQVVPVVWDRIPFIPFKYNSDELSLLEVVQSLVDDYDINTSNISNLLQDIPNSIKVVRNYDGTDKEEFTQNLSVFRTAFVKGDGDMTNLESNIDTDAADKHLSRLRKDIYEAGMGVDTQESEMGDVSGVALNFRYADLDLDCGDLASEMTLSLSQLFWFILVDMANRDGSNFFEEDYDILFNTDTIMNTSEIIKSAKESIGIVSDKTIRENHPWVVNEEEEAKQIKKENAQKLKEAQAMLGGDDNFGTGNPSSQNEDPTEE